MSNEPIGEHEPIDWHAAAARQQQHNLALIRAALGDVGDLDQPERQFIAQVAWDGGHLELASLLRKARQAAPIAPPEPAADGPADTADQLVDEHDAPAGDSIPDVDEFDAWLAEYRTFDGVVVTVGLLVWTNEARQGAVTKVADWPGDVGRERDVWHEVTYPDGRRVHMNRERMSTRDPFGNA